MKGGWLSSISCFWWSWVGVGVAAGSVGAVLSVPGRVGLAWCGPVERGAQLSMASSRLEEVVGAVR